jgi:two-component system sensor histidine kinase DesK
VGAGFREGLGGTGLKGLTERLGAAGGSLTAGPGTRGGFAVAAELPVEPTESVGTVEPLGTPEPTGTPELAGADPSAR